MLHVSWRRKKELSTVSSFNKGFENGRMGLALEGQLVDLERSNFKETFGE
jgi:hypothetical protein